jgi:hypothetical protein
MEGGALLQVDQATLTHQEVLGRKPQRRQNPDMDRRLHLCAGSNLEEKAQNPTLFE